MEENLDDMEENPDDKIWFLAKKELVPEDYLEVAIKTQKVEDPNGSKRYHSDGSLKTAMVWLCDLTRGGVKVESDLVWSHPPPIDVAIYQLEDEEFKKLMGREKNENDAVLVATGAPVYKERDGWLGRGFTQG